MKNLLSDVAFSHLLEFCPSNVLRKPKMDFIQVYMKFLFSRKTLFYSTENFLSLVHKTALGHMAILVKEPARHRRDNHVLWIPSSRPATGFYTEILTV